jgi:hypothetical protein
VLASAYRQLPLFLRVTLILAAAFVGLIVAAFLFKIVVLAAILAALGLGGLFVFNFVKAFVRVRTSGNPPATR